MQPNLTRQCIRCAAPFTVAKPSSRRTHCTHACFLSRTGSEHARHKPKVTLACEHCAKRFEAYPYEAGRRRFCSPECSRLGLSTGRRGPATLAECPECGEGFVAWAYRLRQGRVYCPECARPGRRRGDMVARTCPICSKSFPVLPSQAERGWGTYCSRACFRKRPIIRVSVSRDSAHYTDWRDAVYRRDGWRCQDCGARSTRKARNHAHHIKHWATHPELRFAIDNGITLCFDCHARAHDGENTPLDRAVRKRTR